MEQDSANDACREAWHLIAIRDYGRWAGLPSACSYSALDSEFKRLRDAYGQGTLGKINRSAMFRVHVAEDYPNGLKVWFDGERILLIEIDLLAAPYPAKELIKQVGEPEVRLDFYYDIMPIQTGAWIYPSRGLALFLNAEQNNVVRFGLFHTCSVDEYLEEVHPNTLVSERPI